MNAGRSATPCAIFKLSKIATRTSRSSSSVIARFRKQRTEDMSCLNPVTAAARTMVIHLPSLLHNVSSALSPACLYQHCCGTNFCFFMGQGFFNQDSSRLFFCVYSTLPQQPYLWVFIFKQLTNIIVVVSIPTNSTYCYCSNLRIISVFLDARIA